MFYSSKEHKLLGISTAQSLHLNELFVLTWWKKHLQWISLFQTGLSLLATLQSYFILKNVLWLVTRQHQTHTLLLLT